MSKHGRAGAVPQPDSATAAMGQTANAAMAAQLEQVAALTIQLWWRRYKAYKLQQNDSRKCEVRNRQQTESRVQQAAARTRGVYGSMTPTLPTISYRYRQTKTSPRKGGQGHQRNKSLSPSKRTAKHLPPINV